MHRNYFCTDVRGKIYFVDVIYALLRAADKNTNPSGNYTFFSMQQKHDFLSNLSRIYKKRVVLTLKKKLQHEHFEGVDVLRQIQSARAIQTAFTTSRLRTMRSPQSSLRQLTESSLRVLSKQSSIFNFDLTSPRNFFLAFAAPSEKSSTSDGSSEGSYYYSSSDYSSSSGSQSSSADNSDDEDCSSGGDSVTEEAMWSEMEKEYMGPQANKCESIMLPQLVSSDKIIEYKTLAGDEEQKCPRRGGKGQVGDERKQDEEKVWEDFSEDSAIKVVSTASPGRQAIQTSSQTKSNGFTKPRSNFSIDQSNINEGNEVDTS